MNLSKYSSRFKTVDVLFCIRTAENNLFGILAVDPALDRINAVFTNAEFNRSAHWYAERCHLAHSRIFIFFDYIVPWMKRGENIDFPFRLLHNIFYHLTSLS